MKLGRGIHRCGGPHPNHFRRSSQADQISPEGCLLLSKQLPRRHPETIDEDRDQEGVPHGHTALPRPSYRISEHRFHSRPMSTRGSLVLRCWGGHSITTRCRQGSTDRKSHYVSKNRGRGTATASSPGPADCVRGHTILRGFFRN